MGLNYESAASCGDKLRAAKVPSRFEAIGIMVSICHERKCYSDWTIRGIERLFVPAIDAEQYSIFFHLGIPVGFLTWAGLSKATSNYILESYEDPRPYEWRSGATLWIIDFVCLAPFVRCASGIIRRDMFSQQQRAELKLNNGTAYSLRRDSDGRVRKVAIWKSAISP